MKPEILKAIEELRRDVEYYGFPGSVEPVISFLESAERERDEVEAMRDKIEAALATLCDGAHGQQYDPSWIRPKQMGVQAIKDCMTQAYHQLHDAIKPKEL